MEDAIVRKISDDSLYGGRITCFQYEVGYRFSIDAVLLSHFCTVQQKDRLLDLGTGCGIIGLILLYLHGDLIDSITGIEKQSDLANLCRKNISANNNEGHFKLIHGDIAEIEMMISPEQFSQVVLNPPYYFARSGRQNSNHEAALARHQSSNTLSEFISAAAFGVRNRGKVVLVYPASLIAKLFLTLRENRIEPKRLRFVYPYPDDHVESRLVLVEGIKNGGLGAKILPPLYIHRSKGGPYSKEVERMYHPKQ